MVKALIFDCFGVLYEESGINLVRNQQLLDFTQKMRPVYKIGMLSNIGTQTMNRYFTQAERSKYFDYTVISSEVGLLKPHSEIFAYAASRLGVEPQECIMIDDSEVNCSGALDAGFADAIFYKNFEDLQTKLKGILK